MQAKIQRRFPAVRAYHKKRLPPILKPKPDDDPDTDADHRPHGVDLTPDDILTIVGSRLPLTIPKPTPPFIAPTIAVGIPPPHPPSLTPLIPLTTSSPLSSSSGSLPASSLSSSIFPSSPIAIATTIPGTPIQTMASPKTSAASSNEGQGNFVPTSASKARTTPVGSIVGVILAVFVAIALLGLLYRRRSITARLRLRRWADNSGSAVISPWIDYREKLTIPEPSLAAISSNDRAGRLSGIPLANGLPYTPPPRPPVPPPAYGSKTSAPVMPPRVLVTLTQRAGAVRPPSSATVQITSTFIPTLPDELSISIGDGLRVLAEHDDGWALCVNARGEKGMVPLECFGEGKALTGAGAEESVKDF